MAVLTRLPSIIMMVVILAIDVYIFLSMQDINKDTYQCKCAQTSHVKKISDAIIVIIGMQLLVSLMTFVVISGKKHPIIRLFTILPVLVSLLVKMYYIYLMFTYLDDLKTNKCMCVDKKVTDTVFYYSWARLLLLLVIFMIFIGKYANKRLLQL